MWERKFLFYNLSAPSYNAFVVFDFTQSLFLKRSFDSMQTIAYMMLLRSEGITIVGRLRFS